MWVKFPMYLNENAVIGQKDTFPQLKHDCLLLLPVNGSVVQSCHSQVVYLPLVACSTITVTVILWMSVSVKFAGLSACDVWVR